MSVVTPSGSVGSDTRTRPAGVVALAVLLGVLSIGALQGASPWSPTRSSLLA